MNEVEFFDLLLIAFGLASVIIFIVLFFISAPYGKHVRTNWGPIINNKYGWFIMEVPTVFIYLLFFFLGNKTVKIVPIIFLIIWETHYIQRAFIFPFLIRGSNKMPISIILFGMLFNCVNTYIQSRWVNTFSKDYNITWVFTPFFIGGIILFFVGFIINLQSDHIIRNLRAPNESNHKIPQGGLFKYVSCPNYLGEIIEWGGWAIMTWSIPGVIFLAWTFANLAPRARSNHLWYKNHFSDYPEKRKALIPFIF